METERLMQEIGYLKDAEPRNLILMGKEREGMFRCAQELAASWLQTSIEDLAYHPDYRILGAEGGSIGSEHAEMIQRMASYMPQSERAVCIVTEADTMTVELQNKLLKVLEDGEKTLAVIFITSKALLDTITSRCMTVEFQRVPLGEMVSSPEYKCFPALLASDGSPELYERIIKDDWFNQYLEEFYMSFTGIMERSQLKNILQFTHALREKDRDYLPDKLEDWQMQAYLCMIKQAFWYVMISKEGAAIPKYVKMGNLPNLYETSEAEQIYLHAQRAQKEQLRKGAFSKNDFFELLMVMIPNE